MEVQIGGVPVVNPASIQNEQIVPIEKMAVGVGHSGRTLNVQVESGRYRHGATRRNGPLRSCDGTRSGMALRHRPGLLNEHVNEYDIVR